LSGELDSYYLSQYDIYIGGNWTNNVVDAGFGEVTGTITFNGSSDQLVTSSDASEIFYNDILDNTNTFLKINCK